MQRRVLTAADHLCRIHKNYVGSNPKLQPVTEFLHGLLKQQFIHRAAGHTDARGSIGAPSDFFREIN